MSDATKHEVGAVSCGCGWHPSCVDDWLGWAGVQTRIEDDYYDALVDFAFAMGELTW